MEVGSGAPGSSSRVFGVGLATPVCGPTYLCQAGSHPLILLVDFLSAIALKTTSASSGQM